MPVGVSAGSALHSGCRSSTAASVSVIVAPGKIDRAVSISYSTQPNAQISARLSAGRPLACSGLM
jgi:hypothetical protein